MAKLRVGLSIKESQATRKCIAPVLLLLFLGAVVGLLRHSDHDVANTQHALFTKSEETLQEMGVIVVSIGGHVNNPGVYRLNCDDTVTSLVMKAGLNLPGVKDSPMSWGSMPLLSGQHIEIVVTSGVPTASFGEMSAKNRLLFFLPLNINTASPEDFMLLPGIGPKTAESMVSYRERAGAFGSIEAMTAVKGIGPSTLEKMRPYIWVPPSQIGIIKSVIN